MKIFAWIICITYICGFTMKTYDTNIYDAIISIVFHCSKVAIFGLCVYLTIKGE